jgi:hypothetical protein
VSPCATISSRLHKNETLSAAVAAEGRRFATSWLTFPSVVLYLRTLLQAYGELFQPAPRAASLEGFSRITTEEDVRLLTGMCEGCKPPVPKQCQKPRVSDAKILHDIAEGARGHIGGGPHLCTLWAPPGGGRCHDPRCCEGWDCGTKPLACPTGSPP